MAGWLLAAFVAGAVAQCAGPLVDDAPVVPVAWVCGSAPVPGNMSAKGVNRTSVPANYLPLKCRA